MDSDEQRAALARLIRERGDDYAGLSRLLGRNAAYIQQFIKRGSPRRLSDEDRRLLATYFGVPESALGGPSPPVVGATGYDLVTIPELDVRASAGPGAYADQEIPIGHIAFTRPRLRQLCGARPSDLSIIRVDGDSMHPTLADGDEILVDRSDDARRLRDGIYVLKRDGTVVVKRLAVNPATQRVTVKSDNPAYPVWPECNREELPVIGRVVWAGHKIS
jgi:hypothetical protein